MDFAQLYAAMVEQDADRLERERRERQQQRIATAPSVVVDVSQNARIHALERENVALKDCLGRLIELMVNRDVIDQSDVQTIFAGANSDPAKILNGGRMLYLFSNFAPSLLGRRHNASPRLIRQVI